MHDSMDSPESGLAVTIFTPLEVFRFALTVRLGGGMCGVLLSAFAAVFAIVVASMIAGFGCA